MQTALDVAGLADFGKRLLGGIHGSLSSIRRAGHDDADARKLRSWPVGKFGPLDGIHGDHWIPGRNEPFATIDALAEQLRDDPQLLNAVVFSTHTVLCRMVELCDSTEEGLLDAWIGMCWIAEAVWAVVTGKVPTGSAIVPGDALLRDRIGRGRPRRQRPANVTGDVALLRPVAARMRFLVLSEPMRARGQTDATLWAVGSERGGNGDLQNTFGPDSWTDLVGRCRQARREWQDCLDTYQSHPLLRHARPDDLEQELRAIVFGDGRSRPLVLSVRNLAERAPVAPEDTLVITDSIERHLLPRFAVGSVARLALYDDRSAWQWMRRLLAAAVAGTGLASAACAAALLVHPAVRLALLCYALLGVGVAVLPAEWGMMWLLRMPAASAVGVFALIAVIASGWVQSPRAGWTGAAVLLAVSFGYLLAEVRNHGVARRAAPPRALLVTVIGAVHALMVSMIGLVLVAPALVQSGDPLEKLWANPGYAHTGTVIVVSAAWCLAVGVFSQILWDDRPITAPLAHLSWRG